MSEPRPSYRHVDLDATQVVTLAHPLRSRLLGALRGGGPATATTLAVRLGTNTGTTSYHLRKLAEVGLVEDDLEHGDGRDRWWRAAQDEHSYRTQDFADNPDASAAADWLYSHYLDQYTRQAQDWVESRSQWPTSWQSASTMSDYRLVLTPEALTALNAELDAVVGRYRDTADPGLPSAERVTVLLHDFPVGGAQPA